MSSQLQLDANRKNAQSSTGPKSEEGKAKVSQNARKHGLSAKLVSLSPEEQPDFDLLQADLRAQVKPAGALEELQFRALVIASWRIETINRMQANNESSTETLSKENEDEFRRLERHRATNERTVNRSMKALTQLQTMRQLHAISQRNLQQAYPNAPVQDTQMPAFTDLGKVTRDAKKLPCKTKPMPSYQPTAEDINFMNMVNEIMRTKNEKAA